MRVMSFGLPFILTLGLQTRSITPAEGIRNSFVHCCGMVRLYGCSVLSPGSCDGW